jgi:hypothetical protein
MPFLPFIALIILSFIPDIPPPKVEFRVTQSHFYTQRDQKLLAKAIPLLNKTVNSPEFQERFLAANFTETNGLTNRQVLKVLLNGLDKAHHVDLRLIEYYNSDSDVIGFVRYDIPGTIFQNRHYMWNEYAMASNLLHESLHLLGFDHLDEKQLYSTVPYRAQQIFLEVVDHPGDMP